MTQVKSDLDQQISSLSGALNSQNWEKLEAILLRYEAKIEEKTDKILRKVTEEYKTLETKIDEKTDSILNKIADDYEALEAKIDEVN